MKRFLYCTLLLSLLTIASCKKNDEAPATSFTNVDASTELNLYAGDSVKLTISNFDNSRQHILYNNAEITNYIVTENNGASTTLYFPLPAKGGSGYVTITDDTKTIQGPKINYQKQYVYIYLPGYALGYGMTGTKDDKMIAWDPLEKKINTIRFINISLESNGAIDYNFGLKSTTVTIPNGSFAYDKLGGVGQGPSGNLYFFETINSGGSLQGHLYTSSDLTTAGDYSGGVATGQYSWISDLKLDSKENIYTVEYQVPSIKKVTPAGVSVFAGATTAGHTDGNGTDARFTSVTGIAIDKSDNLFVSDGNCVRMITPTGAVTTITGSVDSGDKTGAATSARYNRIVGLCAASDGTLYMLDNDNGKMKILSSDRQSVTTLKVAGSPNIAGSSDDFNVPIFVDSKSNIFYMIKSAPTKSVSLLALINEDNVSAEVLSAAVKDSGYVDWSLTTDN